MQNLKPTHFRRSLTTFWQSATSWTVSPPSALRDVPREKQLNSLARKARTERAGKGGRGRVEA